MIRDDEGDSIDPFMTDEPKAGPPVSADVARRVFPINSIPELKKSE